jgi:Icc-related predicted phosphoesterase
MHLIASWCLEAAPLTTTMEHRGGQDNDDGASWWLPRPGTGPGAGTGGAGAAGDAGEARSCRQTWDSPAAVQAVFLALMRETLDRWLDLASQRLAGTGIPLYVMMGNDDPPELAEILSQSPAVTYAEDRLVELGEGVTMISCGWSNRTPWHTPRELDEDDLEGRIEKLAAEVPRPERSVFNLHVPPARTAIDLAPALDGALKPRVRGGAVMMEPVGSEAVRRVLERHQPMLGLHGHIHESRGAVRLGRTRAINPGSEYGDGVLRGALIDIDGRKGIRGYQLPSG